MPNPQLNATIHRHAARSAPRAAVVTRKDFTDRLGLPANATNDQVLAAVDAVKAPPKPAAAPQVTAEDALYAAAFGDQASADDAPTADDALYRAIFS
jgi:hypothetical protein